MKNWREKSREKVFLVSVWLGEREKKLWNLGFLPRPTKLCSPQIREKIDVKTEQKILDKKVLVSSLRFFVVFFLPFVFSFGFSPLGFAFFLVLCFGLFATIVFYCFLFLLFVCWIKLALFWVFFLFLPTCSGFYFVFFF